MEKDLFFHSTTPPHEKLSNPPLITRVGTQAIVPFAFGKKKHKDIMDPITNILPPLFNGELNLRQQQLVKDILNHLNNTQSTIISEGTGGGKTVIALYLIAIINIPTIICAPPSLFQQWIERIKQFLPSFRYEILNQHSNMKNGHTNIFFLNPQILNKERIDHRKTNLLFQNNKDILLKGAFFLVIDELHKMLTEKNVYNFLNIIPKYIVGMSATPYRNDYIDQAVSLYLGDNKVGNAIFRSFTVNIVPTTFRPIPSYNRYGMDWNKILNDQYKHRERNILIRNILIYHTDLIWLVIVKRVEHAKILRDLLKEEGHESDLLVGSIKKYNPDFKILIGTNSKIGVGFDNRRINALLIAGDIQDYFEQTLGRCTRSLNSNPTIYDLKDNNKTLQKHLVHRQKIYRKSGGQIFVKDRNVFTR